jgi:arylsulfatase A-like enzyme
LDQVKLDRMMQISRRAALAAPLAIATAKGASAAPAKRRNIIFVLIDDLRFDAMGFLHPGLKTPNIDRLAREGVHFRNAFVTTSLCSPSRATILTGLPMRDHGIVDNNNPEPRELHFFPEYLQAAGYQTAFIGKWHMGAATDAPRPGFDFWASFAGQGSYYPTDGLTPEQIARGEVHMINVNGRRVPQRGYITDELTDYAMDWLERDRDQTKPFFLYLAHKAVHAMFKPSPGHASDDVDPALWRLPNQPERKDQPLWAQDQRNSLLGAQFAYNEGGPIEDYERAYLRTLESVDDNLGRLLAWIDRADLAKDTIVFFASDNGFMWGDRGLIDKRAAYEPSMKIPLLAWAPDLFPAGATVDAMVSNLDFARTFLDLAGAPAPRQFQGRSFLAEARGLAPPDGGRKELIYEYYWEFNYPQTPTTFAIRTDRYKLIQYYGVWDTEELFDLQADPLEERNLIADAAFLETKVTLRHRLYEGLRNAAGRHAIAFGERDNAGSVFRKDGGDPRAPFPNTWTRRPGDPDLNLHVMPDGPAKDKLVRARQAARKATPD